MDRSCLGCRENISTGQIILFCSCGEMFSRLPGKVSRCDVDFVKCKQKVFPLLAGKLCSYETKIISVTEIYREEYKAIFHIISYQGEISLVNLSKCFFGNRDNFCPYEQALTVWSEYTHDLRDQSGML